MASRGGLSGLALAEIAAGVILAWSAVENASITATLRSLISGRKPQPDTGAEPVAGTAAAAAVNPETGVAYTGQGGQDPVSPAQAYQALRNAGLGASAALVLTAIGGAESGWNLDALNNDPATGDYSVGIWQVNYYGDLMASRTAQFGPPSALLGNLGAQARAAAEIWDTEGPGAWTTYRTGAYSGFLIQASNAANAP